MTDPARWEEGPDGVMRPVINATMPPKDVVSATLRSAAHTINPRWTAADCIAHLLMLAEIEDMR
jgi:hypothetical protein